jgi:hypothetical protein
LLVAVSLVIAALRRMEDDTMQKSPTLGGLSQRCRGHR